MRQPPLATVLLSAVGRVTSANPAAERLLGVQVGDDVSRLAPDPPDAWATLWSSARSSGGASAELDLRGPGERVLPAEVTLIALPGEDPAWGLTVRDLRQRRRADVDLRLRARQHAVVADLGELAVAGADLGALAQRAIEGLARSLAVDHAALWEPTSDGGALMLRCGVGWSLGQGGEPLVVPAGRGSHVGYVLERGRTVTLPDLRAEHRFEADEVLRREGVVAGIGTPVGGASPWGVLAVYAGAHRDFLVEDAHLLQAVANLLGTAAGRLRADRERLDTEQQLARAQRLETVGRLAGGVAHDFNNLLAVVLNCARFALREIDAESPAREDLEQIVEASRRATALTRQLLIVGRRDHVEPVPVRVEQVVEDLGRILDRAVGDHVTMKLDLEAEPWAVMADPGQLEQVLLNLAVNARDAIGPRAGEVTVRTRRRWVSAEEAALLPDVEGGAHTELAVSDDGCGMAPEVAARAFEPFFTTKDVGRGTGLGLATVYGIVRGAGGQVSASSEVGVGTTFRILLPVTDEPEDFEALGIAEELVRPGRGERVLVAEDDALVREVLRRILVTGGFEVTAAADGEEALERALSAAEPFDLLVTDAAMPLRSGARLAAALRERWPGLPAICVTAASLEPGDTEFDAVVAKPFAAHQLLVAVRRCLERDPEPHRGSDDGR